LFFPRNCRGKNPLLCEPGVVYGKSQQPCLRGMITNDAHQLENCPVTYTKSAGPAHRIREVARNRFAVSTPDVEYHYRCVGSSPRHGELKRGIFVIDVGPTCDFDATVWSLRGVPEISLYHNETKFEPEVIQPAQFFFHNISEDWTKVQLPPGIEELALPNMTTLKLSPHKSLVPQMEELEDLITPTPWWHYVVGVVAGVVGLVLMVVSVKRFYRYCYEPKRGKSTCKIYRVRYDPKIETSVVDVAEPLAANDPTPSLPNDGPETQERGTQSATGSQKLPPPSSSK
jgi:hypothetical protein